MRRVLADLSIGSQNIKETSDAAQILIEMMALFEGMRDSLNPRYREKTSGDQIRANL
jgi:hypothetical protein